MSASRTLLRKMPTSRPKRTKPGTPFRRVTTVRHPTAASPYEVTFHATKGYRMVRVAL